MSKNAVGMRTLMSLATAVAVCCGAADGTWTNVATGVWSDGSKWVDGIIPGGGGVATFQGPSGFYNVTNDLGTVILSGLRGNPDSVPNTVATEWRLFGGTLELIAPALLDTTAHGLNLRGTTLSGNTDVTITGLGRTFLGDDNLFTGRTVISNGNARVARDSGFGPVPAAYVPDAILLDNGGLQNDDGNYLMVIHANRGITLSSRGGFLGAGYEGGSMRVDSPITGSGMLGINFEYSPLILNSPANDYSGGTVLGTNGPGANAIRGLLRLGQDEVLPHGAGKGGLSINPWGSFNNALPTVTLDLAGKSETVNTLSSGPRAEITSSVAGQGTLIVGGLDEDSDWRGILKGGATIEKQGNGTLAAIGAQIENGTLRLKAGTLVAGGPNVMDGGTVVFDGGDMQVARPSGFDEYKSASAQIDLNAPLTYTGWRLTPEKGSTTDVSAFPYNTQYVYRGRWHLADAGIYSFAKYFDDGGYLAIDGVPLLWNNTTATRQVTNDVALAAGWHTLELRYAQGVGSVGPQGGFRNGIMYDAGNGGFTNAAELARARMFTDDGGPDLVTDSPENVLSGMLVLAQDGTLTIPADTGQLMLACGVTALSAGPPEPVLTVNNGGLPLCFGSAGVWPSLLDAKIASVGGLVLTNRVWLRRLPETPYTIAAGADLALDGAALLGPAALNLTDYSVRVVRGDSVGGDGSVTANAGTTVWFDTMRFEENRLTNSAAPQTFANDVALNGGTARFTGAGTITYTGALTGTGTAVKDGAGDLVLADSGSALSGTIRIDSGRMLPANEAALGGAAVHLNGGRLVNPTGGDLLLAATPVTAQGGGFEVSGAGESMTVNGIITGMANVSKWGDGTLTLGGSAQNTSLRVHVRGGTLALAKSGEADAYAVQDVIGAEPGTRVVLTGDTGNQIGGGVTLSGGVLDLNGHSETLGVLTNTLVGGSVTNSGAQAVTLTVGAGNVSSAFTGTISDGPAPLALTKIGTGEFTLPIASIAYSGGMQVEAGTLRISKPVPLKNGLSYWLDASEPGNITLSNGFVAAWNDASGAGVHFTQSNPANRPKWMENAINGKPAVLFGDGAVRTRLEAAKTAQARTVFIVNHMTGYVNLGGLWGESFQDKNGLRLNSATTWRHTGNGADQNDFSFKGEMAINGVTGFSFASQPLHILTAVSTNTSDFRAALGDYWFSSQYARYFAGYVGEVLVYNRELTTEERQSVEAYLTAKWFGGAGTSIDQPITVGPDGRLSINNFNAGFSALAGTGRLHAENNSVISLTDYGAFTGTVSGQGVVALQAADGADAVIVPKDISTVVRNDGALPASLVVTNAGADMFMGSLQDGAAALGLTQTGTGETYYSGANSTYTGATRIEAGTAMVVSAVRTRFVRFKPTMTRPDGAHAGTGYQLSEFRLTLGGIDVPYPVGTLATSPGKAAGTEGPEKAIDGTVDTKFYHNSTSPLQPLILEFPVPMLFNGYAWYTANDASGRDAIVWTVEGSADGTTWTVLDSQDYSANTALITTARKALVGQWPVQGMESMMNIFSDLSPTMVAAPGKLAVSGTSETVGSLSGDGAIELVANGTLGIHTTADTVFSGTFSGAGTAVKSGAAVQTLSGSLAFDGALIVEAGTLNLDGAVLDGITNIVIRAGAELTGTATVSGDLTVSFEAGGLYSASLAVAGALTVEGPVTLTVPQGAAYPYYGTLFTYASADAATRQALLDAAKPTPVPAGYTALVRVTDTYAKLTVAPVGTVLTLQ